MSELQIYFNKRVLEAEAERATVSKRERVIPVEEVKELPDDLRYPVLCHYMLRSGDHIRCVIALGEKEAVLDVSTDVFVRLPTMRIH